jgi:hypothetical protein
MMRRETRFATHGKPIVVLARITGPRRTITAPLILDTGAVYTTITPKLAQTVGHVDLEELRRIRVRTHFPVHVYRNRRRAFTAGRADGGANVARIRLRATIYLSIRDC